MSKLLKKNTDINFWNMNVANFGQRCWKNKLQVIKDLQSNLKKLNSPTELGFVIWFNHYLPHIPKINFIILYHYDSTLSLHDVQHYKRPVWKLNHKLLHSICNPFLAIKNSSVWFLVYAELKLHAVVSTISWQSCWSLWKGPRKKKDTNENQITPS